MMLEESKKKRFEISKPLQFILFIIGGVLVVYLVWHSFGSTLVGLFHVLQTGNDVAIEEYLSSMGHWQGLLSTYILSILQVISIVFPAMVVQIAAGVIYGWFEGFLVTYLGFATGFALVFWLSRKLGDNVFPNHQARVQDSWLVKEMNSRHPAFAVALACMVPGLPNGIIPHIAAKTKLTLLEFISAAMASNWVQVLLNCLMGSFLISGQYLFVAFSFVIQIVIIAIIFINRRWIIDKLEHD